MNTAGRLAAFGIGLAVAFAGAYATAAAVVPGSAVTAWTQGSATGHNAMPTHGAAHGEPAGLSLSSDGYALSPVQAPAAVGLPGELSFTVVGREGTAVRAFSATHERDMHLMVVRSDGNQYRHVHPSMDEATGRWLVPWQWNAAGTYRVFADFQPGDTKDAGPITLTRTVQVAGEFTPVEARTTRVVDHVGGFTVSLDGQLKAGTTATLTATVRRAGKPVSTLEPYLGAFGHLVALRDGDLAFLHVHPEGDEPAADQRGGPAIQFMADAPTVGRYLLYLDFQVDGRVHTAEFVVDAIAAGAGS